MQTIKILIVTDGGGGYTRPTSIPPTSGSFHLGEFVKVLEDTTWMGFTIDITKAHRGTGAGADLNGFRFDGHDLSQYDEILLFPIRTDTFSADRATAAEVQAISDFMDAGGGVFATGDHENLGAGLCREIPRVRSMRRWYYPDGGPDSLPAAPSGSSAQRRDTTRSGFDSAYQFSDQSDTIAQEITPTYFFGSTGGRFFIRRYPHPLLCSPDGIIRYLPDHPHEGQCEIPNNLDRQALGKDEYPFLPGTTTRLAPVVVAKGRVIGGHNLVNNSGIEVKPTVDEDTFGVIGAYDGHRIVRDGARLGRVVVDSTWHHFFNINLMGAPTFGTDGSGGDPIKERGFYAPLNPGQADHYKMIKHYFRNIVYWLVPAKRFRFIVEWIYAFANSGFFYEEFHLGYRHFHEIPVRIHIRIAHLAEQYFESVRGGCSIPLIIGILWREIEPLRPLWEKLEPFIDPWHPEIPEPRPQPDPLPWLLNRIDSDDIMRVMLGATISTAVLAQQEIDEKKNVKDVDAERAAMFEKMLPEVVEHAMTGFNKAIREQKNHLDKYIDEVAQACECSKH